MCIVQKEKVAIRVIKMEQLPHTNTHLDTKTWQIKNNDQTLHRNDVINKKARIFTGGAGDQALRFGHKEHAFASSIEILSLLSSICHLTIWLTLYTNIALYYKYLMIYQKHNNNRVLIK